MTGVTGAIQIATGDSYTCALLTGGTVKCWGDNSIGQLGFTPSSSQQTPVTVPDVVSATRISTGGNHACATLADHTIKCWGNRWGGKLGYEAAEYWHAPAAVQQIDDAVDVSAGSMHTCALLTDGKVKCWGNGNNGQLGDGPQPGGHGPLLAPIEIAGIGRQPDPPTETTTTPETTPTSTTPTETTPTDPGPRVDKTPQTGPYTPAVITRPALNRTPALRMSPTTLSATRLALTPSAPSARPRTVRLRITAAGVRRHVRSIRVVRAGDRYVLSTRIALPARFKQIKRVRVTITGSGITTLVRTVTRR